MTPGWPRGRGSALAFALVKAATEVRLLVLLGVANLGCALLFSGPWLLHLMGRYGFRPSGAGKALVSGPMLFDLGHGLAPAGGFVAWGVLASVGASVLLQSFLCGGVVARCCTEEPFQVGGFLAACSRLWGRFLRIELWMLLGLLPVAALVAGSAFALHRGHRDSLFTTPLERWYLGSPFTVASSLHLALTLLLLAAWRASVQRARVRVHREDLRCTRLAAWRSARTVFLSPRAVLLAFLLELLGWACALGMARLHASVDITTSLGALLAFTVAQALFGVRNLFRVASPALLVHLDATLPWPGVRPAAAFPAPPEI